MILGVAVLLVIFLIPIWTSSIIVDKPTEQVSAEINTPIWNPVKLSGLEQITVQDAQNRIEFEFNTPKLPEAYRVVAVHVEVPEMTVDRFNGNVPFRKEALVFYFSKNILTEEQTDVGLLTDGGIIIYVSHTPVTKIFEDAFPDHPREDIRYFFGHPAIITTPPRTGDLPDGTIPTNRVKVCDAGVQNCYTLYGIAPVDQLLSIMESLISRG